MGTKIRAKNPIDDIIDDLFKNGMVMVEDGGLSREVARTLSEIRGNGRLIVSRDREMKKSIFYIPSPITRKRRRRTLRGSIFDLMF